MRIPEHGGLAAIAPWLNTSRPHPEHNVYPHLLRGVLVVWPGQVWRTDITYIRLPLGFSYPAAIIDWYLRRVVSWRIRKRRVTESKCR